MYTKILSQENDNLYQVHHHDLTEETSNRYEVWLLDHVAANSAQLWFLKTAV
jgi:hypothetical protein